MRHGGTQIIENPQAYQAAIERRIKANAQISRERKFDAAYPGLRDRILLSYEGRYTVLPGWVRESLWKWGGLTEKQAAFALDALDHAMQRAEEQAYAQDALRDSTPEWTAGRQRVEGTVVSAQIREGDWGAQYKALVKLADNRRLWVTIPNSFGRTEDGYTTLENMKGLPITMTVTIEPAKDKGFAFGKRPVLAK